MRMIVPE